MNEENNGKDTENPQVEQALIAQRLENIEEKVSAIHDAIYEDGLKAKVIRNTLRSKALMWIMGVLLVTILGMLSKFIFT